MAWPKPPNPLKGNSSSSHTPGAALAWRPALLAIVGAIVAAPGRAFEWKEIADIILEFMPTTVSQLFASASSSVRAFSDASSVRAVSRNHLSAGIWGSVLAPADAEPEDDASAAFYCDACEKGFNSQSAFVTHKSSHISCSFPGCKFVGSRRVVADHASSYHRHRPSQTSQEVTAYIEARKKRYPTDANVGHDSSL